MNSFNDVWDSVCAYCRNSMHEVAYNTWISSLQPVQLDGSCAVIRAKSDYQKTIVEDHYRSLLQQGLEEVFGFPVSVRVVAEEQAEAAPAAPAEP